MLAKPCKTAEIPYPPGNNMDVTYFMRRFWKHSCTLISFYGIALGVLGSEPAVPGKWIPTWVSSQQLTEPHNLPPEPGLSGNTLRQVIQPKLAGTQLRVVFSNEYGDAPLTIGGASVAVSAGADRINPESHATVTFSGRPAAVLQPGTILYSDPVDFAVRSFENLAVTLHAAEVPDAVTGHPGSRTTSYICPGPQTAAASMPDAVKTDHWYLLSSVEVRAHPGAAGLVIIGDSITDGRGSTTNENNRWPDQLARRIQATPGLRHISVLNQGVGGGRMLRDGLGVSAIGRLDRDVIAQPCTAWLVVFIGVNDIAGGKPGSTADYGGIAEELIAGYRQIIRRAGSHGIRVIGATIMPFKGHSYYTEENEAQRQILNAWIRSTTELDGVIDFDRITRDPGDPERLAPAVDGGDHLHPSAQGYAIMAKAIDLELFRANRTKPEVHKHVALVFDDGPFPEQAEKLLPLLEKEDLRVTFAQVASRVLAHPETTLAMRDAGHEVVNHSYYHRHPAELSDAELEGEIAGAQKALAGVLGSPPAWYWPPYLEIDDRVRTVVARAGFAPYSPRKVVSSEDWDRRVDAAQILANATTGVEDGSVILFHEWREETIDQLPAILAELRRQGCRFLTFSELQDCVNSRAN